MVIKRRLNYAMIFMSNIKYFADREDAGRQLAFALRDFKNTDCIVMALPRGGVVPATVVAEFLECPMGLILVKKIGHPSYPEFAIGAVISDGTKIYNHSVLATIPANWITQSEQKAATILKDRQTKYFQGVTLLPDIKDKHLIVIDDGIATGLTMQAAIKSLQNQHPREITIAVPVASRASVECLSPLADRIIVIEKPENFLGAVGAHYLKFEQVPDKVVRQKLREVQDALHKKTSSYAPFA